MSVFFVFLYFLVFSLYFGIVFWYVCVFCILGMFWYLFCIFVLLLGANERIHSLFRLTSGLTNTILSV